MREFNMDNGVFSPVPVDYTDELDKFKKLVFLYSCHQKLTGRSTVIIRPKLITLLALYLQHGYTKDTRAFAASVLSVKPEAVNSMNLEIRNLGLLLKDKYNTRINHLSEDLIELKGYLNKEDPEQAMILFRLGREQ